VRAVPALVCAAALSLAALPSTAAPTESGWASRADAGVAAGAPTVPDPAAPRAPVAAPGARPGWRWPLPGEPVPARAFSAPPQPWAAGHRGVDLPAVAGQDVLAPAAGVVTFAGRVVDRTVLVLGHPGGLRSSFEPVQSPLPVGTVVGRGQPVAQVAAGGVSHCAPATCLHWGVRRGRDYLDPVALVSAAGPPVLLPPLLLRPARRPHAGRTPSLAPAWPVQSWW
jgi:murein DD-endopeptidase MepM/ murein hydrolase activator NlpD